MFFTLYMQPATAFDHRHAALNNNGQSCLAGTRLFVHAEIASLFQQKLIATFKRIKVSSPLDEDSRNSCLVNSRQGQRVLDYSKVGLEEGAELLAGDGRTLVPGC